VRRRGLSAGAAVAALIVVVGAVVLAVTGGDSVLTFAGAQSPASSAPLAVAGSHLDPSATSSDASTSASASESASSGAAGKARPTATQPIQAVVTTSAAAAAKLAQQPAQRVTPTAASKPVTAPVAVATAIPAAVPPIAARPGGRPGSTNTGVPTGTNLTVVNGDVIVTTNGTVIDAGDIKGALFIKASNVIVRNSLIEGSANSDSVVISSGTGILLEDDEVAVRYPTVSHDAMSVHNATLHRLNIHGGVDGMKLGSNSLVENSWIHGLNYFASDPAQGGGPTHNDAIQIMSGSNIHIDGNYLQPASSDNSAIQVTQDTGRVSGVYISSNWADGGGCTFNFSGHGPNHVLLPMSGITATGNRFGRNSHFVGCAILTDLQTTITATANVYDDNGAPVSIQRHN